MAVTKTELTLGLPFSAYRAIDAVNWSTLKDMAKSPAHYKHRVDNDRPDSTRMAFGRAVHTAVLEPDEFPSDITDQSKGCVVYEGARRAGKAWDEFAAANGDKTILKADEYRACVDIRDAVLSNPTASRLLTGNSEVTATWADSETGIACKGRFDHINTECIVDLKTTSSVDDYTFTSLSARMLYHSQLAFYNGAVMLGNPAIIAVEVEPPYDVAVFRLTDDLMYAGMQQVSTLMTKLAHCTKTDTWPGRYCGEVEMTLPGWLQIDDHDLRDLGVNIAGARF